MIEQLLNKSYGHKEFPFCDFLGIHKELKLKWLKSQYGQKADFCQIAQLDSSAWYRFCFPKPPVFQL
jgi:hypothetical protein